MTAIYARSGGTLKATTLRVRASGVLKDIANAYVRSAGVLKQVYASGGSGAAFDVMLNPSEVAGYAAISGSATIFTQVCSLSITGGLAPYTYAWTVTGSGTWTADTPSAATTTFKRTSVAAYASYSATISCTVTDARGFAVAAVAGLATVENFGSYF